MRAGILSCGTYVPAYRLNRADIGAGAGTRSVASYDEDSTSLAVEAARRALVGVSSEPSSVLFATSTPAYADKTNATAIHRALGLAPSVGAYDMVGSMRSAIGSLRAAVDAAAAGRSTLVVAADIRAGLTGSVDEQLGGDAGAALVVAPGEPSIAEVLATGTATEEFLDRWRIPGEVVSRMWEERFGETVYVPLATAALSAALQAADLDPEDIDHLIVTGLHHRAVATVRRTAGFGAAALADDLAGSVGVSGAAHPFLVLADVLAKARAGDLVVLLVLADGADAFVLRAGELAGRPALAPDTADTQPVSYDDMRVWRGLLRREPPRRPTPDRPAAPPSLRNAAWKFGFVGSRCRACETRHLPPQRVCLTCHSIDQMDPEPLAARRGTVTTFSVDHLAFSVAPPVVVAVVDFDGGGRLTCELTDVDPGAVRVGTRVELTFRRLYTTADGVHDYFWKARPVPREEG